jgi:hypothetical protein
MNETRNAQVAEMCRGDRTDFRKGDEGVGTKGSEVEDRQGSYDI